MNTWPGLFVVLCLCTWCTYIDASTGASALELQSPKVDYGLSAYLSYFVEEDETSIEQVTSPEWQDQFTKPMNDSLNFGFEEKALWLKLDIAPSFANSNNRHPPPEGLWFAVVDFAFLDHVEFYAPIESGYSKSLSGDLYPFFDRETEISNHLFPLNLKEDAHSVFYFRVKTSTSLQFPLQILHSSDLITSQADRHFELGVFSGILLVMIIYNLFIFFSVRDRAYAYYILYIVGVLMVNMIVSGIAYRYLWPQSPWLANYGFVLVAPLTLAFALAFTRTFLSTERFSRRTDLLLIAAMGICAATVILPFIVGIRWSTFMAVALVAPVSLLIFIAGIQGLVRRERRAYFFVGAWLLLLGGMSIRSLLHFDIFPVNWFTLNAGLIGATAEVMLLSLALADRINTERAQRLTAVERALDADRERLKSEQALLHQSLHDDLTGAPNRTLLCRSLESRIFSTVTGEGSRPTIAICTVSLSNLQEINVTLGARASEQIFRKAINALSAQVEHMEGIQAIGDGTSETQNVARLQGANLAFALQVESKRELEKITGDLCRELGQPFYFKDMTLDLGRHLGFSVFPTDGEDPDELLRKSLIAAQVAEQAHLPYQIYSPHIDLYNESNLSLKGELANAIENAELKLFYQPKYLLDSGKIYGVEALIRWEHPDKGLLSPDHFISTAESTGLIQPLTLWVIQTAIKDAIELHKNDCEVNVAINISVRNLLNKDFYDEVHDLLSTLLLEPGFITFEVTESAVIEDMPQAISTLERLNSLGIRISLDDFGTGYSSLKYLKDLPINELKIDRSFIKDIASDRDDQVIVQTTLAIANALNLDVVAEGIENEESLNALTTMKCRAAQGFYFARPMSMHDLQVFLGESPQQR